MSRSEQRRRDRGQGGGPAGSSPTPVSREVDGRPAKMHDDDGCGSISSLNPRQQRALKTSLASLQGDALTYIILSFIGALSGGVAMRLLDLLEHIIREAFNLNDDDVTKEAIQEMEANLTQTQRRFYDQVIGQVMDLKFEIDGEANSEQLSDELGSLREMLTSGRPTPMNHDPRGNGQRGRGQNRRSQEAEYDEDQGGDEEEEYYEEPPRPTRGQQRPQQRPQPQGRPQNRPQPRSNGRPQRAGFPAPRRQAGYDPNYDEGFDRYGGQTQEVNIDEMSKVELKNSLLVVLQNNRKLSSQKGMMSALFFVGWIVTMFFQTPITRGLYYAYDGTVNWVYSFGYEDLMLKQQRREQLALEEKKARQATAGSFESVVTAKTAEERENARMKYDEALLSSIGIFNDARKARDEHDAIIKRFTPQAPATEAPAETATPTVTKPAEAAPQPAAPAPAVIPPAAETPAEGEKKSE